MSKLPRNLSGQEVVKALGKAGFYLKRQQESHIILRRDNPFAQVEWAIDDFVGVSQTNG